MVVIDCPVVNTLLKLLKLKSVLLCKKKTGSKEQLHVVSCKRIASRPVMLSLWSMTHKVVTKSRETVQNL